MINRLGRRIVPTRNEINNYLNHRKFYEFAAQFVEGRRVVDVGCGSGYGCEILAGAGAAGVHGCDVSERAVAYARDRFRGVADFRVQGITDLRGYAAGSFEVTVSSEVLEHIEEYGREDDAVRELKRVTAPGGVLVVGTPNVELTDDHGFTFDEIDALFRRHFRDYVVFENALVPFGARRELWAARQREGRTGVVVSERIDLDQTFLPGGEAAEVKTGLAPGTFRVGGVEVDTTLLHNTHSWVVIAVAPAGAQR